jgi:hypothetical protein
MPCTLCLLCSLSFDHPNLVRTLHYARLRLSDTDNTAGLVGTLG